MLRISTNPTLLVSCALALFGSRAAAQSGAWLIFPDAPDKPLLDCDAVNAGNEDLLVIDATRDLETLDGFVVPGSFVEVLPPTSIFNYTDIEGTEAWVVANVFIDNAPFGFLAFTDDGDGLRSLWWLGEFDGAFRGVELFADTLEPFIAELIPFNTAGASCDACDLLVDSPFCPSDDGSRGGGGAPRISF